MSTLLAGDVSWWTPGVIERAFGPDERVYVLGGDDALTAGNVHALKADDAEQVREALRLGFDSVVFLSWELDYGLADDERPDELGNLGRVLEPVVRQSGVRVLYVATSELDAVRPDSAVVRRQALEGLCGWYQDMGVDLEVLRAPHLTSDENPRDYWRRVGEAVRAGRPWEFSVPADQPLDFVDMRDLARLVGVVLGNWDQSRLLRLRAPGSHTFGDAAHAVDEAVPGARLSFADAPANPAPRVTGEAAVEEVYAFSCEHDVVDGIALQLKEQVVRAKADEARLWFRIKAALASGRPATVAIELALLAALVEWANAVLGTTTQFAGVDFRLVYVVLFSATYGVGAGLAAAAVMIVALGAALVRQGVPAVSLALDATYWAAFFLYLIVASALGYLHNKAEEDVAFANRRADVLQGRFDYEHQLYDEACAARNEYRHDLLESRDGFGRIFDVVKRLSLEDPSRIFTASIGVLEDVLDTRRAAIYVVGDSSGFARLTVSSKELDGKLPKSLLLSDYADMLSALANGEVWFNASLAAGEPSYVAGVRSKGQVRVLIMLYDARFEQASAYYLNLVRILAGLMESFLLRAWNEEQSHRAERLVPGTGILAPVEFEAELETMRERRSQGTGDYRLLAVDAQGRSVTEVDALLEGQMRGSDVAGVGANGTVYLLLSQVDDATLPIVVARFERAGIHVEPVSDEGAL